MLTKYIEFVNGQLQFHEHMAKKFAANKARASKHLESAAMLRDLLAFLQRPASAPPSVADDRAPIQLDLTFEEVEGLPPELIQELSISDGDRTEFAILRIMREAGGVASLDRLLVGLYRQTGEVMKRTTLTSRIYRMSQKGMIFSVPNRKGAYSTKELTADEVQRILN